MCVYILDYFVYRKICIYLFIIFSSVCIGTKKNVWVYTNNTKQVFYSVECDDFITWSVECDDFITWLAQYMKIPKICIHDKSGFMDKHMTLPARHAHLGLFWEQRQTTARRSRAKF